MLNLLLELGSSGCGGEVCLVLCVAIGDQSGGGGGGGGGGGVGRESCS